MITVYADLKSRPANPTSPALAAVVYPGVWASASAFTLTREVVFDALNHSDSFFVLVGGSLRAAAGSAMLLRNLAQVLRGLTP